MRFHIILPLLVVLADATGSAAAAGDVARGEIAYTTTCTKCHASAARLARQAKGGSTEEKATFLEGFLPRHYAPDPAMRADIITFLLSR